MSISFSEQKKYLLSCLQQGDLVSAGQALQDLKAQKASSSFQISETLFLEAKLSIYEGQYLKALNPLEASLIHQPTFLAALCDLALCHYQLGLNGALQKTLKNTYDILMTEKDQIDVQEALDAAIFVAKLFEELGQVDEALLLLEQIGLLKISAKQEQALNIQKLRLAVECGDTIAAKSFYQIITGGLQHTYNFEVEREHSLLLADCFLFGLPQALERFAYLQQHNMIAADRSFINSEMAEHLILQGSPQALKNMSFDKQTESEYEKHQARMIEGYFLKETNSPLSVIRLEKVLSIVSLLRLMRQSFLLFPQSADLESAKTRYRFYCAQIPSKKLQAQFQNALKFDSTSNTLLIDSAKKSFVIGNKEVPIKTALFWQLIPLFKDQRMEASLDEVIEAIYKEEPNMQHFDRLRMAVSRLNASIKSSTDIEGLFKVSKNSVTLLIATKEHAS